MSNKSKKKLTLGLAVSDFSDDYQIAIRNGIVEQAQLRNCNLVSYWGGMINAHELTEREKNSIYKMIHPEKIDGIILLSGPLSIEIYEIELVDFFKDITNAPQVSVGIKLPGMPSLVIDNSTGVRDVVEHLITEHNYQDIAFVKGPELNEEATARFNAYKATLLKYGLSVQDEFICDGDFSDDAGENAVREFYDIRKISPDAIVCVDDNTALHVITSLEKRGLKVPTDVAVTGFDNIEASLFSNPPLTTISQPLFELGANAVDILIAKIEQYPVPESLVLNTHVIYRRSCGCSSAKSFNKKTETSTVKQLQSIENGVIVSTDGLIDELVNLFFKRYYNSCLYPYIYIALDKLLGALEKTIKEENGKYFFTEIDTILSESTNKGIDISIWEVVINTLVSNISLQGNGSQESFFNDLRLGIVTDFSQFEVNHFGQKNLQLKKQLESIYQVDDAMTTNFNEQIIKHRLETILQCLNVKGFQLSYFHYSSNEARLHYTYTSQSESIENHSFYFQSREIIPEQVELVGDIYNINVIPIVFKDILAGFMTLEIEKTDAILFEVLVSTIVNTLTEARLVNEIRDYTTALEKDLEFANQKSKLNEIRADAILENHPDPVFSIDKNGGVHWANKNCRSIFEYDVCGKNFKDLVHYSCQDTFLEKKDLVVETNIKTDFECLLSFSENTSQWFYITLFKPFPKSNKLTIITRDISELKNSKKALQKAVNTAFEYEDKLRQTESCESTLSNIGSILGTLHSDVELKKVSTEEYIQASRVLESYFHEQHSDDSSVYQAFKMVLKYIEKVQSSENILSVELKRIMKKITMINGIIDTQYPTNNDDPFT